MGWLYLWHYRQIPLSMIVILILPFSLFQIFKKLHQYKKYSTAEYISLKLPFSIYTAWVTVASIANFMALLVYFNDNWPANFLSIAAVIGILIGLFIAVKILDKYKNIPFPLVVIWALTGIIGAQLGYQNTNMAVVITAGISIAVILFKIIPAFSGRSKS
jgi:xanthosine utilization system XapX-like protein